MSWYQRIWDKVSAVGVRPNLPEEMEKHVVLTNQFAFTWIFLIIPYATLFSFYDLMGTYLLSFLIGIHIFVIYLNHLGKYNISRMLEAIVPQLIIFILAATLFVRPGKDLVSSYYMLNLAFLAIPFMIYSLREYIYIIISIAFSVSLYYLFEPINQLVRFNESSELYTLKYFEMYNYTVSWVMTVVGYLYVKRVGDIYQKKMLFKEEKFRKVFNSATDGIVITDYNGVVIEMNELELSRTSLHSTVNVHIKDLYFQGSLDVAKKQIRQINKKGASKFEFEKDLKRKGIIYYEITGKLFSYEGMPAILFLIHDITERKHLQRKIVTAVYETEEKERKRFAQDLHDGIGALLAGVKMYMSTALKSKDPEKTEKTLKEAMNLLGLAVSTTKEIANNIIPDSLSRFGLTASLETLISRINSVSETKIVFKPVNIDNHLPEDVLLVTYRVIHELITNALKHSKASTAHIHVFIFLGRFYILYMDNGVGFDYQKEFNSAKPGSGLSNIANRLESINATLNLYSIPNNGTDVVISIPLPENNDVTYEE